MTNVKMTLTKSDQLVLIVDLKQEHGWTKTGQNVKVGCSDGNVFLWKNGAPRSDKMCFNLNVYKSHDPQ
jgi:hypothetical protein